MLPSYQCLQKGVRDFFVVVVRLDLELIANIKNAWFLHTHFLHFINNSRSKQNEKILKHPFV